MDDHKPFAAGFKVIRQTEEADTQNPDPDATKWTVHFKTPSGVESSVVVPAADYNAQAVAEKIAEKAKTIEEVHALGGAALPAYRG